MQCILAVLKHLHLPYSFIMTQPEEPKYSHDEFRKLLEQQFIKVRAFLYKTILGFLKTKAIPI